MCSIFGVLDYKGKLEPTQRRNMVKALSIAAEVRGTDATGIAFFNGESLRIQKAPKPAHRMKFNIPNETRYIIGHTRMTTQGSERKKQNNHPFPGNAGGTKFALAHNGVLINDRELALRNQLPQTNIETDSYVAVQMIERTGAFDLQAIQQMAEQIEGSFCFTLLDGKDNLYLVKGNNPLTIYHFEKLGFYIYASTEDILQTGLRKAGFIHYPHKEVKINLGDIVILKADGMVARESFNTGKLDCYDNFWFGYRPYSYSLGSSTFKNSKVSTAKTMIYGTYLESLIDYAVNVGVTEEEVLYLYENGFDEKEIEALLYSPEVLHEYLEEMMVYGYI